MARAERLLVIRRSRLVAAPRMICFPGGGVEAGESDSQAVCREFREELSAEITSVRQIWSNQTASGILLSWWEAHLRPDQALRPNPAEVEEVFWASVAELIRLPDLLPTNQEFLRVLNAGQFQLSGLATD